MSDEPRPQPAVRRGKLLVASACVALVVGAIWARAVVESRMYHAAGASAEAREEIEGAILQYRRAAQWYAPLGTRSRDALERLIALGDDAREQGRIERALFAWRSARMSIMATRHVWVPHEELLEPLHDRIAAAMAEQVGEPEAAERFEAQLASWRARRPSPLFGLLGSLAFLAWLVSIGATAWVGFDDAGGLRRRPLLVGASVTAGLFLSWLVLLRLA